jgi:hypothetical protein
VLPCAVYALAEQAAANRDACAAPAQAVEHVALSAKAHDMFVLARERYADGVLRRDETLSAMLDRVEAAYYNVRKGGDGGPLGGLLGDLFKNLAQA